MWLRTLLYVGAAIAAPLVCVKYTAKCSRKDDPDATMWCKRGGYKPLGCRPIDKDHVLSLKEMRLERLHQLKEGRLKSIDEKIKSHQEGIARMKEKAEWCKTNPIKEYQYLEEVRQKILNGEEKEFGNTLIMTEKDKKEALDKVDKQLTHQKNRINGNSSDSRDYGCGDFEEWAAGNEKAIAELTKEKEKVQKEIDRWQGELDVDPAEFSEEEVGPLSDVIPSDPIPVYFWENRGKGNRIARESPIEFSHEKHLPHIMKTDMGCASCHSDGMGTLHDHIEKEMVGTFGDKRVIVIGRSYPLHYYACANCHAATGYCSTCHDKVKSNYGGCRDTIFSRGLSDERAYDLLRDEEEKMYLEPR